MLLSLLLFWFKVQSWICPCIVYAILKIVAINSIIVIDNYERKSIKIWISNIVKISSSLILDKKRNLWENKNKYDVIIFQVQFFTKMWFK